MAGPTMTLHPFVFPELRPGKHQVTTSQLLTGGGLSSSDTVPGRTHVIEITAPRFSMPGNEVFGVFPPPNAVGPFAARLAQIVLRSRTLPWERSTSAAQPWLALVVLAEGEANFLPDVEATAAYTAGRTPAGVPADARCAAIEVPQKVITDVFPAAAELELMTHVRHVNTQDTEYADSDGWVSVLISNRLPLPSTAYGAYLISLEGQLDLLPAPGAVANEVTKNWAFGDVLEWATVKEHVPRTTNTTLPRGGGTVFKAGPTTAFSVNDARATASPVFSTTPVSSSRLVSHDIDFVKFADLFDIDVAVLQPSRFPVLAHWEFSCSDDPGDFAGYMNHLDVGLLGSAPIVDPRAPVVPVTATGHVSVAHADRRGDEGRVWYRGPFSPSKITREPAGHPYHVADQARRIGPDGREDTSYAAAFEVGRLLAMSDMQFLRALRQWVREEFRARRTVDVVRPFLTDMAIDLPYDVVLPRVLVEQTLLPGGIGGDPMTQLGTTLPLHEAELLFRNNDSQIIARGLGVEAGIVAVALGVDLMTDTVTGDVLDIGINTFEEVKGATLTLSDLRGNLATFVAEFDGAATAMADAQRNGAAPPLVDRLMGGLP